MCCTIFKLLACFYDNFFYNMANVKIKWFRIFTDFFNKDSLNGNLVIDVYYTLF